MACFLVPAGVGFVTTALRKRFPENSHPEWLNSMLWGGVAALAVEHLSHGEIVPYPPFLTAMKSPADIPVMIKEMTTVGGAMTLAIFAIWVLMVVVAKRLCRKNTVLGKETGG